VDITLTSRRLASLCAALTCSLFALAVRAAGAPPGPVNPAPTAKDWADLAQLPDWSGVWFPESWTITTARHPPAWRPEVLKDVEALKALEKAGHPKGL
jgi:hypothetical protein